MKRPRSKRNLWIDAGVFAFLVLTLLFFTSNRAFILNPAGYGAVAVPMGAMAAALCAGAVFFAMRLTAGPNGDVWLLPALVAPLAGLFGYALAIGGVPAISLMVSTAPITVEAQVSSSGSQLNSTACKAGHVARSTVAHIVRLEDQPPLTGPICLPSVRSRNASGQLVLAPPPMPDPGPVLIDGQGNWFAVWIDAFRAR